MDEDTRTRLERLVLERDDARQIYESAQRQLTIAVVEVLDAGEPGAEVARVLRVSRQRINQMRKREDQR